MVFPKGPRLKILKYGQRKKASKKKQETLRKSIYRKRGTKIMQESTNTPK